MKEVKVATLTKEETKRFKELNKMKRDIDLAIAQFSSAQSAFWKEVISEHSLLAGNHYIVINTIYKQEI